MRPVERVVALGGRVVDDRRTPDGAGWVVMADPEGNELCIERALAERDDAVAPVDDRSRPTPVALAAGEREMLVGMLDWYRAGVVHKVEGVNAHHASAQPFRSATSIAGLVKHLALVEGWFSVDFAGQPDPEPFAGIDWDADPNWEFRTALDEPLPELVELYAAACECSRAVVAVHDLDDLGASTSRPRFTLRFVLLHLIEETARHLGHLDILREHLDGTTGR